MNFRRIPYACSYSFPECGTAPYFNHHSQLGPAFNYFVQGRTELNHTLRRVHLYGNMGVMTTITYGCEGAYVSPAGTAPMPNRELFVLIPQNGVMKLWLYTFTYNTDLSQMDPPKSVMDAGNLCKACPAHSPVLIPGGSPSC